MLYSVMNPMGYVNEGYRLASESYANMDKSYKETRSSTPPPHTVGEAIMSAGGGGFAGYHLGKLLGEAGLSLPPLLGGATQTTGTALASESPPLIGEHWGLSPKGWGALIGAGIGLLSYLFS